MYTYGVIRKKLKELKGDPSWPEPYYEYIKDEIMNFPVPVRIGDYIDGRKVIVINHSQKTTIAIVEDKVTIHLT